MPIKNEWAPCIGGQTNTKCPEAGLWEHLGNRQRYCNNLVSFLPHLSPQDGQFITLSFTWLLNYYYVENYRKIMFVFTVCHCGPLINTYISQTLCTVTEVSIRQTHWLYIDRSWTPPAVPGMYAQAQSHQEHSRSLLSLMCFYNTGFHFTFSEKHNNSLSYYKAQN